MMKTPILTHNSEMESMLDSPRPSIQEGLHMIGVKEAFSALVEYDEENDRVVVSFSEDQLVLLHGVIKQVIDLQTMCGATPINEMLELESTISQGVDLFEYVEEEDE